MERNLPAVQETQVPSLGWEDPLATHSSILAWRIPWAEGPGGLQSIELHTAEATEQVGMPMYILGGLLQLLKF